MTLDEGHFGGLEVISFWTFLPFKKLRFIFLYNNWGNNVSSLLEACLVRAVVNWSKPENRVLGKTNLFLKLFAHLERLAVITHSFLRKSNKTTCVLLLIHSPRHLEEAEGNPLVCRAGNHSIKAAIPTQQEVFRCCFKIS